MSEWKNEPFVIDVKAGDTHTFCMCGLSNNPPFCDGSHQQTATIPSVSVFDEDKTIYVCGCKQSASRPYCDGSHQK